MNEWSVWKHGSAAQRSALALFGLDNRPDLGRIRGLWSTDRPVMGRAGPRAPQTARISAAR